MILFVSGRTDIIAFYSKWFLNRLKAGFVDVRNPFNPHLVSRINFRDVDAFLFCTKNPLPILPFLKAIKKPMLFHVTITPYKKDIEPNVPNKKTIIAAVKKISQEIGIDNTIVRYDPIFLSPKYNLNYHIKAFEKLCSLLDGYVKTIIVSFLDDYQNVRRNKNILNYQTLTETDYKTIGLNFSQIAKKYHMSVQTCFEDRNLSEYGFKVGDCLSKEIAFKLTGKNYPKWKARKERKCNCVAMVDIGAYNTCGHFCKYCYANYDEAKVKENRGKHDPNSSILIGNLKEDDIIKERLK